MSYVTNWREGIAAASAKIDALFGEALVITPCYQVPNYPAVPYLKESIEVQGVFSYKADFALNTGDSFNHRRGGGGVVETRKPIASFSRAQTPWMLEHGDQIARLCDGSLFEIISIEPDGVARIVCNLNQLGRANQ